MDRPPTRPERTDGTGERPSPDIDSRHGAEGTWDRLWRRTGPVPDWDDQCQLMLDGLTAVLPGPVGGLSILEAGAGTGRVTARLAAMGAETAILDTSETALAIARRVFERVAGRPGRFIQGSIFALPCPDRSFDLVWNAGLLEHFTPDEKRLALREMLRATRPGGTVVSMNPYARALAYRIGKWVKERSGTWPYGYERPVASLRGYAPEGSTVEECVIGGAYQLRFLPLIGRSAQRAAARVPAPLALWARRWAGGYLLVSVLRQAPQPHEPR